LQIRTVDKAVRAAHSAFRSNAWPNLSPTARGRSETNGEGVFHLGFEVPDADAAESEAQRAGLAVTMQARRQNRTGFTHYDTVDKAGVILLTRATNLPGK
jgi:methylmalonyl-CoA/ethylmalonyl-CoA epimerase